MKIEFIEHIPKNHFESPILISEKDSEGFQGKQFLSLHREDGRMNIYEIRYEYHASPFKQAEVLNHTIIVGYEEHCYLFDIDNQAQLSVLKLSGYFGHIYLDNEFFYVADANGLYCLNQDGTQLWLNRNLGIDGVVINDIGDFEISGSGEWDPPGGWEDFVIDKRTGKKKEKRKPYTK